MSLPFTTNSITVYKYEPFDISWSYPGANSISKAISSGIPSGSVTDLSSNAVRFSSSATGFVVPTSSNESIVLRALDASLNVLATSSNAVTIAPGRFLTDGSLSLDGRVFTFYRNEPTVPTNFFAPFALGSAPVATPTLPAGLVFASNSPSNYRLQGTPLLQTPNSNYLIIGSNVGGTRFATTRVTIGVQTERLVIDVSGTGIVSLMEVGTAITPQMLTARCPPYPTIASNVRYSWTQLPLGLEFADSSGTTVSSPYLANDASSTLILRGTPTYDGAKQFVTLGLSQANVAVTATRVLPPVISNSQTLTFSFAESVLFDDITIPTLYTNLPLDPSETFVQARTYFGTTDASITTIFSPNLRADLSLNFVATQGRAYLIGNPYPSSAGSASYTFRASNTNGKTRDVSQLITVLNDSVTLAQTPVDVCYNFIVSRNASNAKTGYFPAPIAWTATVASGEPVTFTAPALTGTGLSLSVSGNTATLSGTPTATRTLRNLRVTATAALTGASASRDVSFAVIADQFTFAEDPSWNPVLYQNRAITPVRISATTLSERSISTYSSSNLPAGLSITNYGVITGTPTTESTGLFTVVASTGFAVGSNNYSYSVLPDTILFFADPNPAKAPDEGYVLVQLSGLSYANNVVTNFTTTLDPSYGLILDASTGVLSGTLSKTIPDGTTSFTVSANSGLHSNSLPATLTKASGTVLISFDTTPPGGPIVLSPSNLSRTIYQYVPIAPLRIIASGAGTIRYFVRTTDLPPGMFFNQVTGTFTGKSVERGVRGVPIYAKDDGGLTPIPFVFTTIFPVIVRDGTTTASSYTSLLRQYTVVNAARNAENNEVYPSEVTTIGEFTRPYPPDETTQTVDPKCYSTSNCP